MATSLAELESLREERGELFAQLDKDAECMEVQHQDYRGLALQLADVRQQLGSLHSQLKTSSLQKGQMALR